MRFLPAAVAVLALGLPASAAAAPAWLPSFDVSPADQAAEQGAVAVNGAGEAIAIWRVPGTGIRAYVASRAPGGAFGTPEPITEPGAIVNDPEVELSTNGTAIAIWTGHDGTNFVIEASVRDAGGTFGEPVQLSASGQRAQQPHVAMDGSGNAIAVWIRSNGTNEIVEYSERPAGGAFSTPQPLSDAGFDANGVQVAKNIAGDAIVAWTRNNVIQARIRPAGSSFGAVEDLSAAGASTSSPQVAIDPIVSTVDPTGSAVVAWNQSEGMSLPAARWAANAAGGAFGPPGSFGGTSYDPQVGMDAEGNAIAIWVDDTADRRIRAAVRPPGGSFSAGIFVTGETYEAYTPRLAVSTDGTAVGVWNRELDGQLVAEGAVRPPGGSFAAPQVLSDATVSLTEPPDVAVDATGNALAIWREAAAVIKGAIYDSAAPELHSLSVPPTGVVGTPVAFSVSPFDAWSAVSLAGWDFGDGGTATGNAVEHTYSAPGTYTVSASASDAAPNTGSASRQIQISALPVPVLSDLLISPRRFKPAKRGGSIARARRKTKVSYSLDRAALVTFRVQRRAKGRRVEGRCVKPKRSNRKRPRCARWKAVRGSFINESLAGANQFRFTGRLDGRRLKPGRYRLNATPQINALIGATVRAKFRIVRR